MGRISKGTIQTLQKSCEPMAQHAAAETYLFGKVHPDLTVAENQVRIRHKADVLERAVVPEIKAVVRHELLRLECNLPAALGRKALGTKGFDMVRRINEATYVREILSLTRDYLVPKVTSKTSEADNVAYLQSRKQALLANVAVSCAPWVAQAADGCIRDVGMLRIKHAEALRRSSNNSSSFSGGSGGGGGGGA